MSLKSLHRISGFDTISIRPEPALLRSIDDALRLASNVVFAVSLDAECEYLTAEAITAKRLRTCSS
jgi:hypothetical protein